MLLFYVTCILTLHDGAEKIYLFYAIKHNKETQKIIMNQTISTV